MPAEVTKPVSTQNSFLDALHSESTAGSEIVAEWLRQVQEGGAIESLFRLETWLKGLRSFFSLEHLPLDEAGKNTLLTRGFYHEISIVAQAIRKCEMYACDLSRQTGGPLKIEEFVEAQMRRDRLQDQSISRIAEQLTPADSISQLMESLNDMRIVMDSMHAVPQRDFQLFLTLGRIFNRELKNCRYIDTLLSQRFRLQFDFIDNKALTTALRRIQEDQVRRNTALVFLYLFRFLKYLKLVAADLNQDRPLKPALVVFSLLHEETEHLSDFLRMRLLRNRDVGSALQNAAELIAYSIKTESHRVQSQELIGLSGESNPSTVYTRVENSHGLLRNCFESCILTLVQSVDKKFDAAALFPSRTEQLSVAEKLRQDLWDLRRWLMDVLAAKEDIDSNHIIEKVIAFKEDSMRSLMFRDWAGFESFIDSVALSVNFAEVRTHIRKFVSYLETLIQEVSKRSVFRQAQTEL